MKKYLFVLLLMMFLCPPIGAQTFKRATKMPSFFVPKGALQTGNRPENLVPIEEMNRMLLERNPKIRAEYQHKEQMQTESQKTGGSAHHQYNEQMQAEQGEFENIVLTTAKEENTQNKDVDSVKENNLAVNTDENDSAENKYAEEPIVSSEDEAFLAQIIDEYRRDIVEVSKGEIGLNRRIVEMVSDYKDFENRI